MGGRLFLTPSGLSAHKTALHIIEWRNGLGRTPSPLGASLEVRPSRYALEKHSTRESILLYPRSPSQGRR
jgi:hypothetical protein